MKIRNLALAAVIMFLPVVALASEFKAGDNLSISQNEQIADDLYISGNNVSIDGKIDGDLFAAGGTVTVSGDVSQSAYLAGGQVDVNGVIERSLKVGSGNVSIKGEVKKDLFVAGGSVIIEKDAKIDGDVFVASGTLTVYGETKSIKTYVGDLFLKPGSKVNGDVTYWSDKNITRDEGAFVSGNIVKKEVSNQYQQNTNFTKAGSAFSIILLIIFALLAVLLFPKATIALSALWRDKFGFSLLWGALFAFFAPIAILFLFISIIGIPLAIGLMLVYPIYLFLGKIFGVIALGQWLTSYFKDNKGLKNIYIATLAGVLVFSIIGFIPGIGFLAKFIVTLAGVGVLVDYTIRGLAKLR